MKRGNKTESSALYQRDSRHIGVTSETRKADTHNSLYSIWIFHEMIIIHQIASNIYSLYTIFSGYAAAAAAVPNMHVSECSKSFIGRIIVFLSFATACFGKGYARLILNEWYTRRFYCDGFVRWLCWWCRSRWLLLLVLVVVAAVAVLLFTKRQWYITIITTMDCIECKDETVLCWCFFSVSCSETRWKHVFFSFQI